MARLLRSNVIAFAVVALCAAWGYSRPVFGQDPKEDPATPTAPTASTPAKVPEIDEALKQFQLRNFDKTTELLGKAVTNDPNLPPAHVIMFDWFARSNQAFLARMALERAVMNEPKDPEAYIIMGNIALQERRVTDAELQFLKAQALLKTFEKSLKRKEKMEPITMSGLASVAEAREKWADAQAQLEALLKLNLDPKENASMIAQAMQRLARAHFQLKHADVALNYLRKAKETDKDNVLTPEAALARFYEQYPDHTNAVVWMKRALDKAPDDLSTVLVAAQWALETNQLPEAEKYATKALALAEHDRTVATDEHIAQTDARLLNAKILRGLVALFKKDYKTAEKYFEDAHLQSPSNFAASNNLALALCEDVKEGKPDPVKLNKALEYANANYQQKPRDAETASTLGWVLYKAGYRERAESALRLAASSGNLGPDTAYYFARVIYDPGASKENKELAKNLLEAALKTPAFPMRPESRKLLDEIKAEAPAKEKAKDKS